MTERVIKSEEVVVRSLLERGASRSPDEILVSFEDGGTLTRAEALGTAYAFANELSARGIRRDDRVLVMLPNGADFLRVWWGIACLGAVIVPAHVGFRGAMLRHLLELSAPALIVTNASFAPVFDEEDLSIPIALAEAMHGADRTPPRLDRPIEYWDTAICLLTSGTTGPSKLASCTYLHGLRGGANFVADGSRGSEDCLLVDIPLYHGAALRFVVAALGCGVRLHVRSAPSLSTYWQDNARAGVTMTALISSMVPFLTKQPPSPSDRDHKVRVVLASPPPRDPEAFKQRFGIAEIRTGYGSTEVPGPLASHPDDELRDGYCGRLTPDYECRLVDENDLDVPEGTPGELILRTRQPWQIICEYVGDSSATAKAWRNGWFHTGDVMRGDALGRFFFVDRVKDSLRRRGENISSVEVEKAVALFPGVIEAACVGAVSDGGDDEVKVWLVVEDPGTFDPHAFFRFCADGLPYFMVPRFAALTDEFPKTPSMRIRKHELRNRPNGEFHWDREELGISVKRPGAPISAGQTAARS